jgi:transposase
MKVHRNAKTNVYQRQLLIRRVRHQGWTQRRAAAAAGVSIRTVAKWVARPRGELADRSSRPHRQPRRLSVTGEARNVPIQDRRKGVPGSRCESYKLPRVIDVTILRLLLLAMTGGLITGTGSTRLSG